MRPAYQEMLVRGIPEVKFKLSSFLQHHRNQLPIAKYRDEILSILDRSQILVLSGETGW